MCLTYGIYHGVTTMECGRDKTIHKKKLGARGVQEGKHGCKSSANSETLGRGAAK